MSQENVETLRRSNAPTIAVRALIPLVVLALAASGCGHSSQSLTVTVVKPNPNPPVNHRSHSYQTLVASELPKGEVESVEFKNKNKALDVKLKNKESYEVGFIDQAAPELMHELHDDGVPYNVESGK
jgi:hypothetical protein